MLASVVANCHRDPKQRKKPFDSREFIPRELLREAGDEGPKDRKPETLALTLAMAFGAPPEVMAQLREAAASKTQVMSDE